MIKIVGIEIIPPLGNGRPENGTGKFVETLMYRALRRPGVELTTLYTESHRMNVVLSFRDWDEIGVMPKAAAKP